MRQYNMAWIQLSKITGYLFFFLLLFNNSASDDFNADRIRALLESGIASDLILKSRNLEELKALILATVNSGSREVDIDGFTSNRLEGRVESNFDPSTRPPPQRAVTSAVTSAPRVETTTREESLPDRDFSFLQHKYSVPIARVQSLAVGHDYLFHNEKYSALRSDSPHDYSIPRGETTTPTTKSHYDEAGFDDHDVSSSNTNQFASIEQRIAETRKIKSDYFNPAEIFKQAKQLTKLEALQSLQSKEQSNGLRENADSTTPQADKQFDTVRVPHTRTTDKPLASHVGSDVPQTTYPTNPIHAEENEKHIEHLGETSRDSITIDIGKVYRNSFSGTDSTTKANIPEVSGGKKNSNHEDYKGKYSPWWIKPLKSRSFLQDSFPLTPPVTSKTPSSSRSLLQDETPAATRSFFEDASSRESVESILEGLATSDPNSRSYAYYKTLLLLKTLRETESTTYASVAEMKSVEELKDRVGDMMNSFHGTSTDKPYVGEKVTPANRRTPVEPTTLPVGEKVTVANGRTPVESTTLPSTRTKTTSAPGEYHEQPSQVKYDLLPSQVKYHYRHPVTSPSPSVQESRLGETTVIPNPSIEYWERDPEPEPASDAELKDTDLYNMYETSPSDWQTQVITTPTPLRRVPSVEKYVSSVVRKLNQASSVKDEQVNETTEKRPFEVVSKPPVTTDKETFYTNEDIPDINDEPSDEPTENSDPKTNNEITMDIVPLHERRVIPDIEVTEFDEMRTPLGKSKVEVDVFDAPTSENDPAAQQEYLIMEESGKGLNPIARSETVDLKRIVQHAMHHFKLGTYADAANQIKYNAGNIDGHVRIIDRVTAVEAARQLQSSKLRMPKIRICENGVFKDVSLDTWNNQLSKNFTGDKQLFLIWMHRGSPQSLPDDPKTEMKLDPQRIFVVHKHAGHHGYGYEQKTEIRNEGMRGQNMIFVVNRIRHKHHHYATTQIPPIITAAQDQPIAPITTTALPRALPTTSPSLRNFLPTTLEPARAAADIAPRSGSSPQAAPRAGGGGSRGGGGGGFDYEEIIDVEVIYDRKKPYSGWGMSGGWGMKPKFNPYGRTINNKRPNKVNPVPAKPFNLMNRQQSMSRQPSLFRPSAAAITDLMSNMLYPNQQRVDLFPQVHQFAGTNGFGFGKSIPDNALGQHLEKLSDTALIALASNHLGIPNPLTNQNSAFTSKSAQMTDLSNMLDPKHSLPPVVAGIGGLGAGLGLASSGLNLGGSGFLGGGLNTASLSAPANLAFGGRLQNTGISPLLNTGIAASLNTGLTGRMNGGMNTGLGTPLNTGTGLNSNLGGFNIEEALKGLSPGELAALTNLAVGSVLPISTGSAVNPAATNRVYGPLGGATAHDTNPRRAQPGRGVPRGHGPKRVRRPMHSQRQNQRPLQRKPVRRHRPLAKGRPPLNKGRGKGRPRGARRSLPGTDNRRANDIVVEYDDYGVVSY